MESTAYLDVEYYFLAEEKQIDFQHSFCDSFVGLIDTIYSKLTLA